MRINFGSLPIGTLFFEHGRRYRKVSATTAYSYVAGCYMPFDSAESVYGIDHTR